MSPCGRRFGRTMVCQRPAGHTGHCEWHADDSGWVEAKRRIEARHEGDPAYEGTHESPQRLRAKEEYEREQERYDQ